DVNDAPVIEISEPKQPVEGQADKTTPVAKITVTDEDKDKPNVTLDDPDGVYNYDPKTGNVTLTAEGVKKVNSGEDLPPIKAKADDNKGGVTTAEKPVPPTT
ncbi:hypothetical protein U5B43_10560, partial [Campylobacter sp. 9BO]|uniref:hypothetical protein n=1 Tax=Campylobacter sp. 9BO TaxID=3424759 RepID=UPI003D33360E